MALKIGCMGHLVRPAPKFLDSWESHHLSKAALKRSLNFLIFITSGTLILAHCVKNSQQCQQLIQSCLQDCICPIRRWHQKRLKNLKIMSSFGIKICLDIILQTNHKKIEILDDLSKLLLHEMRHQIYTSTQQQISFCPMQG